MKKNDKKLVGIIMGSKSDWEGVMQHCSDTLKKFGIKHDVRVISAHRTPKRLHKFLKEAENNQMEVIIAAAGMSAEPGARGSYHLVLRFGIVRAP